jgi:hypothetical protein
MASNTEQYFIDGCLLHHCHLGMVHKTLNAISVLTMITIMVMVVMLCVCLLACHHHLCHYRCILSSQLLPLDKDSLIGNCQISSSSAYARDMSALTLLSSLCYELTVKAIGFAHGQTASRHAANLSSQFFSAWSVCMYQPPLLLSLLRTILLNLHVHLQLFFLILKFS